MVGAWPLIDLITAFLFFDFAFWTAAMEESCFWSTSNCLQHLDLAHQSDVDTLFSQVLLTPATPLPWPMQFAMAGLRVESRREGAKAGNELWLRLLTARDGLIFLFGRTGDKGTKVLSHSRVSDGAGAIGKQGARAIDWCDIVGWRCSKRSCGSLNFA